MNTINIYKFFIPFFLTSIMLSCEQDIEFTTISLINLPEVSETFRIDEGCYEEVFVLDSFLIMMARCDDYKIHVYDKNNLKFITKFGTAGQGPCDFNVAKPLQNSSSSLNSNNIILFDTRLFQLKTVNLNKLLSNENIANCVFSAPVDRDLRYMREINKLGESKFAAVGMSNYGKEGLFVIMDTLTKENQWIEFLPKKRMPDRYKRLVYYGFLGANSDKNSIIYASRYFDQILFYDMKGQLKNRHVFSKLKMPELSKQYSGPVFESIYYSVYMYASPNYCFVFRLNQNPPPEGEDEHVYRHPTQLLVYNWDGVLVKAFEIPVSLSSFNFLCYDDEFGYLYLSDRSTEENDMYETVRKIKIGDYLRTN